MKLILGADNHGTGRTDEELHYSVEVFRDAYRLAEEHGAEAVVWAGDLLHFKDGLELRLLLQWSDIIQHYSALGIKTVMIPGNHDKLWKTEEEFVAIRILPCTVYTEATAVVLDGVFLGFLPWFPPEVYKREAYNLAMRAANHPGLKFLISHTPLAEGFVSASNIKVEQPIRIPDLLPEFWDKIFLGDYHAHQECGPKIVYLGAPRPTTFGDRDCKGYWLLETYAGRWSFNALALPTKYPRYHQLTIGPFGPPTIPDYDPDDKYIVRAATQWMPELGRKYPGVQVRPLSNEYAIPKQARFTEADLQSPFATAKRWLAIKGLEPDVYYPICEEAIKECSPQVR